MAQVSLRNVSKIYPGEKGQERAAVRDFSLEIADREFVVLLGPPGCGKSTVLRLLAGLEKVSGGDLFIADKPVNDVAPKDRDIAMVFQDCALYPHMSVFDNLAFGLQLRKYPKPEIKQRVVDAAGILRIDSLLERKPKALSADQRARVALARAIVRQAKVFLLDEPLSALDAKTGQELRMEISKLHQRLQATMIYATRDPDEAMAMGDRVALLNAGAMQQNDTAITLYNQPANLFVAKFLGCPPMNFVHGTLKTAGDKIRFSEIEGGTIEVAFTSEERPPAAGFIGKPVVLGLRPEDLEVTTSNRQENRAATTGFPAIVDWVEPLGAETNLYLQTGAHTLVCRSRAVFDHREAGHRFHFGMNLNKAHLFDPVSGKRII
jgi:multiple sugar transport system ATP-binding protein